MACADPAEFDRLVALVRTGDRQAFRRLFDGCYREVRIFVASRAPDAELVDEVVQAAWVIAYEKLSSYRGGGSFLAWLKGIARNCLLRELEQRRRNSAQALDANLAAAPETGDLADRLAHCLGMLTPQARQLLDLRYGEALAVQVVANRLGRPVGSVSVSMHRIRAALRTCLGPEVLGHD